MRLGLGLPNYHPHGLTRQALLDWAREAEAAGFHNLASVDKPNYDGWDIIPVFAAVAAVTERIRLVSTILQLPNRSEVLVAKQTAVIDRVSEGRLDLGLAVGAREDDYAVLGAEFRHRGARFEAQLLRMHEIWELARGADAAHGVLGPAPMQTPGPPLYLGGSAEPALDRAARLADGYIVSAGVPAQGVAALVRDIRDRAAAHGRRNFKVGAIAYCATGPDPDAALEEGIADLVRYYGMPRERAQSMLFHGSGAQIAETLTPYMEAGLDWLSLLCESGDPRQIEILARDVLPLAEQEPAPTI